jgi:hypothetical protein
VLALNEDVPEDTAAHTAVRATDDSVSGWNGSQTFYRHEVHEAHPCPPDVKVRLQAARQVLIERSERWRLMGAAS